MNKTDLAVIGIQNTSFLVSRESESIPDSSID